MMMMMLMMMAMMTMMMFVSHKEPKVVFVYAELSESIKHIFCLVSFSKVKHNLSIIVMQL